MGDADQGSGVSERCLICDGESSERGRGSGSGVCFRCESGGRRLLPIHWEGVVVGFIVDVEGESLDWAAGWSKWRGYWKPLSGSVALRSFLAHLDANGRTNLADGRLFTLDVEAGEAWLLQR